MSTSKFKTVLNKCNSRSTFRFTKCQKAIRKSFNARTSYNFYHVIVSVQSLFTFLAHALRLTFWVLLCELINKFLDLLFSLKHQLQTQTELMSHQDIGVLRFALKIDCSV